MSYVLVNELKEQLKAIRLSLKPSYLWEISVADCDQVLRVCHQLNIDLSNLSVIQINETIFIANIQLLINNLNNLLNESFDALINVSPNLKVPQLLNKDEMKTKKNIIKHLSSEMKLHLNDRNFKMESLNEEYKDMCLICGAMLGYPVIYCNDNIPDGNCLSCQPLCAFSIKRLSKEPIPSIYSFSLPQVYRKIFYSNIDLWFIELNNFYNQNLLLEEDVITMPFVLT
jgi:hypothetical protein